MGRYAGWIAVYAAVAGGADVVLIPEIPFNYDSICAEMPAGSILVWDGGLWHGGGANTTGERRRGIAMNYCAGFIRQQENQQLGIPLATLGTFSPQLQELCGLGVYKGLIGHIDRRPPAAVLFETDPASGMLWDRS